MNNKVVIGVVVIGLLVGIGLLVSSNKSNAPSDSSLTTTPVVTTEPTAQSTNSAQIVQEENNITLTSTGFSPATLTIKIGGKVTWTNKSGADATVHSSPHPTHTDYPQLNLGTFPDGGTLSLAFDKPGTYKYHNHLNASQFGSIIVQ